MDNNHLYNIRNFNNLIKPKEIHIIMLRRKIFVIIIWSLFLSTSGQENVFLLVDVSGSITDRPSINEAKDIVLKILAGTPFHISQYPNWEPYLIEDRNIDDLINGMSSSGLISVNSVFAIIHFGEKETSTREHFVTRIRNFPEDFLTFFEENYPNQFNENWTYYSFARAYTAELAKRNQIQEYYLITIWDGRGEQMGPEGYTEYENQLVAAFNNPSTSVVEEVGNLTKELGHTKRYKIEFTRIDITDVVLPPPPDPPDLAVIQLASLANGTRQNPIDIKGNIQLSWTCSNCPKGVRYKVTITGIDGTTSPKPQPVKPTLSNSCNVELDPGKYRIRISGITNNNAPVRSAQTYIKIKGGGGGAGFLIFLLLAAFAGGGYYLWKKQRDNKITQFGRSDNVQGISL